MPREINPYTGQPYEYSTMGDYLRRGPIGQGVGAMGGLLNQFGGAMSRGVGSIQEALSPLSQNFYNQLGQDFQSRMAGNIPSNPLAFLSQYINDPNLAAFGGQDPLVSAFGQQQAMQPGVTQPTGPQSPIPGLGVPFTDPQMQGLYGGSQTQQGGMPGGGGAGTYQGVPLPQAPKVVPPNIDIAAAFDPVLEQLKDPKRVEGPSKIEGLAQILGGAARGAAGMLLRPETGVGGVFAGAGAGSSEAAMELRREEQALDLEFNRALERVQQARAGVQAQRAGAEMDLARDVANAANAEAQLQFNRDVQASMMSQQQVQPLGDGRIMIQRFDPETGQGTREIIDTVDPLDRFWNRMYMRARTNKALSGDTRKEPKILIDGKTVPRSAVFGAANSEFSTPLEKEAIDLAFKLFDDQDVVNAYAIAIEEDLRMRRDSGAPAVASEKRYAETPQEYIIDAIYQDVLQNEDKRAQGWERVGGRGVAMEGIE